MADVTFYPCAPEHIAGITPLKGEELAQAGFLRDDFSKYVLTEGVAMSAFVGTKCVCAAGIYPVYKHRAMAWSFMGEGAGPHMVAITRKVKQVLDSWGGERVEMIVDFEFKAGHRWAKMLGFEVETLRMRKHGATGNDESCYVRIKE